QFPELVAEAVAATGDPSRWVLCSNSTMRRPHRIDSARRTVFGAMVAAGLEGAADLDRSGEIMLDELFQFASSNLSKWVASGADGDERQSPELFWGGASADRPDPLLVQLTKEQRECSWNSEMVFAAQRPEQPASDAVGEGNELQVTNVSLRTPAKTIEQEFSEAWRLADRLADTVASAPHRLRELRQRILVLEQRARYGSHEQRSATNQELASLLDAYTTATQTSERDATDDADVLDGSLNELAATLHDVDRKAFDAWFKKNWKGELARQPELGFLETISSQGDLEWDLIRLAAASDLSARSAAKLDLEIPGWVRDDVDGGDRLRLFAQQLVMNRVGDHWQARANDLMAKSTRLYENAAERFRHVKEAFAVRDRSLQRLPAFLGISCRTASVAEQSRPELLRLIHLTGDLCTALDPDQANLDEVELLRRSTSAQLERVDTLLGNGLARQILQLPATRSNFFQARRLLSTDLLDSRLRVELGHWIQSNERDWLATFELVSEPTGGSLTDLNEQRRQRFLIGTAELEAEYASLIRLGSESGVSAPVGGSIDRVATLYRRLASTSDSASSITGDDTRSFGQSLERFYETLNQRIASFDHTPAAIAEKAMLLRFLDPRDAWRFETLDENELSRVARTESHRRWQQYRQWQATVLRGKEASPPREVLVPELRAGSRIDLQYEPSKVLRFSLRNESAEPIEARMSLDYDNQAVSVRLRSDASTGDSDVGDWDIERTAYGTRRSPKLTIPAEGSLDLEFEVTRVKNATTAAQVVFDLLRETGQSIDLSSPAVVLLRHVVEVRLPLAEVVVRHGASEFQSDYDGLTLLPFPNRSESFQFGLAGQSQDSPPLQLNLYQQIQTERLSVDSDSIADRL
ncbi:MAG: hypothetical protein AAFU85_32355, partial [Planctomycetota bacterium]